jgi:hypothetical protein
MDISIDNLGIFFLRATSSDSGDVDNVLYTSISVGIAIPYEGAINFNLTNADNLYENSAGWD